ncbi:MAG: hypothetical protein M0Z71_06960 [Nitrospiraceae bacterium]|nr:hypothetical protein [Nitrospiraceae bacterium]
MKSDEKLKIDIILQRCAWVAQIFLFLAAIIGYFLTVRPVYQKQLLDEQIAERTVLLREATSSLEKLKNEETKLKIDNANLSKEADTTYAHLRHNLLGQLSSAPSICTYQRADPLNGKELLDCVTKYVQVNVTAFLRLQDQEKVNAALKTHGTDILTLPQKLSLERTVRLKKARADAARLEAAVKKSEQDFIAEIRRLRSNDSDHGANIRTLKDTKPIRAGEETKVYDVFRDSQFDLIIKLGKAQDDALVAESPVLSEQYKVLGEIMRQVSDKVGK